MERFAVAARRRARGRSLALLLGVLALASACARSRPVVGPTIPVPMGWEETGLASWYGHPYHGRPTASGEVYDMDQMTAAHRTLPFGTWLLVEGLDEHRSVTVRVNDRGPLVDGRILDLSRAAARLLGVIGPGVIRVRLRVIPPPAEAATAAGAWAVQVAAFQDEERARALGARLERSVTGVVIRPAEIAGRTYYRVRVGRFARRDEAERQARELATLGHAVIVVSED